MYLQKEVGQGRRIAVWKLTESVEELLSLHPLRAEQEAEFDTVKADKRKREWLSVRVLLEETLCRKVVLQHLPSGKPILKEPSLHLSVSHSINFVVVFLSPAHPVGVDIEKIRPNMPHLQDKFLHPSERELGLHDNPFLLHLAWGAKEAMFKLSRHRQLLATEHLYLTDVNLVSQTAVGHIRLGNEEKKVHIGFQQLEDHIMVWGYFFDGAW
jgi:4'-phosphopantetheinyl transferase EntD